MSDALINEKLGILTETIDVEHPNIFQDPGSKEDMVESLKRCLKSLPGFSAELFMRMPPQSTLNFFSERVMRHVDSSIQRDKQLYPDAIPFWEEDRESLGLFIKGLEALQTERNVA